MRRLENHFAGLGIKRTQRCIGHAGKFGRAQMVRQERGGLRPGGRIVRDQRQPDQASRALVAILCEAGNSAAGFVNLAVVLHQLAPHAKAATVRAVGRLMPNLRHNKVAAVVLRW